MPPIRKGDGTTLAPKGIAEIRKGDGTVLYSGSAGVPASGISRWEFEDDSDTSTAIDSWGSNALTINGASYDTTAQVGSSSLVFDGVDDYLVNSSYSRTEDFSLAVWIKSDTTSPTSFSAWFSSNDGSTTSGTFQLDYDSNNEMRFNGDSNGIFGAATTSWVLTTITYDSSSSTVTGYLDDTQQFDITASAQLDDLIFGRNRSSTFRHFGGNIDDPRLYSKPLSSTEVSNLYNAGSI